MKHWRSKLSDGTDTDESSGPTRHRPRLSADRIPRIHRGYELSAAGHAAGPATWPDRKARPPSLVAKLVGPDGSGGCAKHPYCDARALLHRLDPRASDGAGPA